MNDRHEHLPPAPGAVTVRLTADEAEALIFGLRGWALYQMNDDPEYELFIGEIPVPEHDPGPGEMADLADKIERAWHETTADAD
jgi:hypothetical protein